MDTGPSWRDQLNSHADQLHELRAEVVAQHTGHAADVAANINSGMIETGTDPQRPDDQGRHA